MGRMRGLAGDAASACFQAGRQQSVRAKGPETWCRTGVRIRLLSADAWAEGPNVGARYLE